MAKNTTDITVLTCPKCGSEVSGPDAKSVKDTMARHTKKAHAAKKGAKK
jgi:uncharacterized C2H2 Zn-finger protein